MREGMCVSQNPICFEECSKFDPLNGWYLGGVDNLSEPTGKLIEE